MRVVQSGIPGTLLAPVHRPEGTRPPADDENNYDADVIEDGGRFWYRVRGTTIEITAHDANRVISNPHLYYVSRALSLHYRILYKEKHGNDYGERPKPMPVVYAFYRHQASCTDPMNGVAHLAGWGDLIQIATPDILSKLAKQENTMEALKPGTLCVIVGGCPENIGLVVEVLEHIGTYPPRADAYLIRTASGRKFPQLKMGTNEKLARGTSNEAITDRHKLRPLVDIKDDEVGSRANDKAPAVPQGESLTHETRNLFEALLCRMKLCQAFAIVRRAGQRYIM